MFTARATKAAAAEATRAAAQAQAEPEQRRVDLEAFRAIRAEQAMEIDEMRAEARSMRSLLRALARAYEGLYRWARDPVGPPPEPEDRVKEYLRTGV
ncbi:hypothetical protein ACIBSV_48180 [Embleya sp. NPDC050154]|uniref:hypothetical protein n=1 Tax=Embleya sp. NPDC050154 TaxID=3363988 RepID=UPI00379CB623